MFGKTPLAIATLLMASVLAGGQAPGAVKTAASAPPYECRFAAEAIMIDGKLDEAAWQRAGQITAFHAYQPADAEHLSPTSVRLLWDDHCLYVAFECEDIDIWSYSDKPDDSLWLGDVAELFIKPSVDNLEYYEFVVAPNGTIFDGRYPSRGAGGSNRFKKWSSEARVASIIDGTDDNCADEDRSYTVEMAIPLAAFGGARQPADGVAWTFGCFRYDYSKAFEEPLLMMSIPESLKCGYHYYEGYGELVFRGAAPERN